MVFASEEAKKLGIAPSLFGVDAFEGAAEASLVLALGILKKSEEAAAAAEAFAGEEKPKGDLEGSGAFEDGE